MRFYEYGSPEPPVILLIPGTCCHHSMFDHVVPLLTQSFRVVVASFDGFDETEPDVTYPDMTIETERIEAYVRDACGGTIFSAYGCSLGGSFVAYLVQRQNIYIEHAIIGSSDMDEAGPLSARIQANIIGALLMRMLSKGLPKWVNRRMDKRIAENPESAEYYERFMGLFTDDHLKGFVSCKSIENQFYSDLVTKIEDGIDVPGTQIHVFYALKMGDQYRTRYLRHFAHPDIREHDLQHEELLICQPDEWVAEVKRCCGMAG